MGHWNLVDNNGYFLLKWLQLDWDELYMTRWIRKSLKMCHKMTKICESWHRPSSMWWFDYAKTLLWQCVTTQGHKPVTEAPHCPSVWLAATLSNFYASPLTQLPQGSEALSFPSFTNYVNRDTCLVPRSNVISVTAVLNPFCDEECCDAQWL